MQVVDRFPLPNCCPLLKVLEYRWVFIISRYIRSLCLFFGHMFAGVVRRRHSHFRGSYRVNADLVSFCAGGGDAVNLRITLFSDLQGSEILRGYLLEVSASVVERAVRKMTEYSPVIHAKGAAVLCNHSVVWRTPPQLIAGRVRTGTFYKGNRHFSGM